MSFVGQPLIISFYTRKTAYEQEVKNLLISCETFELETAIEGIDSLGSWKDNVAVKPFYIRTALEKYKRPLLWVDADAVFLKKPDFSSFLSYDFSVRFMQLFENDRRFALNAATLFINHTQEGLNLVHAWCQRTEEVMQTEGTIEFLDQITLFDTLKTDRKAKILPLPISYCKIYDLDCIFIDDDEVVIEQRQASRRLKETIQ